MLPDNVSDARRVLAGTSLLHLLQSRTGQQQGVLSLAHDSTVGDALNDLSSRGVLSAPLVVFNTLRGEDGEDDEANFSDRPEVPTFLGTCFTEMTSAFADTQSKAFLIPSEWEALLRSATPGFLARKLVTVRSREDGEPVFAGATTSSSLLEVTRAALLPAPGRGPRHRLTVFDGRGQLLAIVSQSDVIRFLAASPEAMSALHHATVGSAGLGRAPVTSARSETPAIEAFALAVAAGVSAVAVVDPISGALVGNLSVSDLRGAASDLARLSMPVGDFTAGQKLLCFTTDTPLSELVVQLAASRVHRAWVVDAATGVPTGVVTLTDVLQLVAGGEWGA